MKVGQTVAFSTQRRERRVSLVCTVTKLLEGGGFQFQVSNGAWTGMFHRNKLTCLAPSGATVHSAYILYVGPPHLPALYEEKIEKINSYLRNHIPVVFLHWRAAASVFFGRVSRTIRAAKEAWSAKEHPKYHSIYDNDDIPF